MLYLPYDRPCMHECVFSDKFQKESGVSTMDIAKRLMDYGYHPPTIYFPLVVSGAIMIEPTETESKEDLDQFVDALKAIAREAKENPELLRGAPSKCKVRRMDEVEARVIHALRDEMTEGRSGNARSPEARDGVNLTRRDAGFPPFVKGGQGGFWIPT